METGCTSYLRFLLKLLCRQGPRVGIEYVSEWKKNRHSQRKVRLKQFELYHTESGSIEEVLLDRTYLKHKDFIPAEGWTVLDLGAHIGCFSLLCASIMKKGRIYSFEPNLASYELLERNIGINSSRFPGVSIFPFRKAVSDKTGTGQFFIDEHNPTSATSRLSSLSPDVTTLFGTGGLSATVETVTLDGFLRETSIDKIDLIKMDIEGAEIDALKGASATLSKTERIVLEYHGTYEKCLKLLNSLGFVEAMNIVKDKDTGISYFTR